MPSHPADEPLLHTLEIEPQAEPADAAVIWLHGLGATCHDFEPIVPHLGLPEDHRIRFVFPQAPQQAVTLNWGMVMPAWYDVAGLDADRDADEPSIRRNALRVEALLARERQRGVAPGRTVLAGFSQGGALALHVGLRHEQTLAGILVLSGYLLLAERAEAERSASNLETPILHCHGTLDPMVREAYGHASAERLRALGHTVTYRTWPMQHEVCLEEIEAIGAWLRERLPPAT